MTFVLRMLGRELRASWRRLLFFFICVAIGVASIVTLRSIIQSVRTGLVREARNTLAADVLIQSSRAWTPDVRADLERQLAAAPVEARSEAIETATMVRAEGGEAVARMVELRGVQEGYPFYGTLALQNGQTYSHALVENAGALVRPELLAQLGIAVGDRILIAGRPFTVRGVIDQEPGRRVGGFSLGSRVLIDLADLHSDSLERTCSATVKFASNTIAAGNFIAIYWVDTSLHLAVPFTQDWKRVLEVMERLKALSSAGRFTVLDRERALDELDAMKDDSGTMPTNPGAGPVPADPMSRARDMLRS